MSLFSSEFVIVDTPDDAVERLAALHQQASAALSQALKRYLLNREKPNEEQRRLFRYPLLRLTYDCPGDVPSTRLSAAICSLSSYRWCRTSPSRWKWV